MQTARRQRAQRYAPEETLQQLDQELQRLGINPQDISLMNCMSLLLWVNDPEALRQFVQGMQPLAVSSETNPAANTLDAQTNAAQAGATAGGNASQGAGSTAIQPAAAQNQASRIRVRLRRKRRLQAPPEDTTQNSSGVQSGSVATAARPVRQMRRNSKLSAATQQFQQLHASLAVARQAAQGGFYGAAISQTQGQLLNISA